jgi:hypothetical protein
VEEYKGYDLYDEGGLVSIFPSGSPFMVHRCWGMETAKAWVDEQKGE